ncbi:A-kinase anchor protein 1, mitochondrial-like [Grus americana]|uniref:A-kinase anchor protein 1, mitochondrial-like n=1 Tax=Grus americana TaxID=9117 RepID=UPI0024080757|nr:A-kinase anchor protein 1, mitochondrial-like [Grus americana]
MPSYFRKIIPYAIPGALALLGCWWIYSHRKKQASSSDKQESVAAEEEQQQEAPEEDSPPKEEAGVPMREAVFEEEEHPENETSTSLPSAESTTPSLPCQTHERPDLSEDHPDLSVTTLQPSTVADDTAKPEATGPPDESSGPACVSLPLTSECQGSAAVSLVEDSSSGANPDQCAAGLAVKGMAFVDNDCATRKAVTHQHAHPEGGSCKSDFTIWEIEVPKALVGRLIGRKGRFMNYLKEASGAKVYVTTLPYFRDSQVCHIEGSAQQVEKVLSLIGQKFTKLCLTNIYALPPPTPLTLHSLLMTAWLFLPDGVPVEVVVANQVDAGHMFLQQYTHPTFHALRSLDQQMSTCYSLPAIPTLPTPVEVGIICAAPGLGGAWLRAQVISYFEETGEVELRYVDYGGYDKVKVDTLRQIRSDFLSLPFQGAEVLLDNVVPLPGQDHFSSEADTAVVEMTEGAVLVAQVTKYDNATGLPLIQLWNLVGDEAVSVNRALVERGLAQWLVY